MPQPRSPSSASPCILLSGSSGPLGCPSSLGASYVRNRPPQTPLNTRTGQISTWNSTFTNIPLYWTCTVLHSHALVSYAYERKKLLCWFRLDYSLDDMCKPDFFIFSREILSVPAAICLLQFYTLHVSLCLQASCSTVCCEADTVLVFPGCLRSFEWQPHATLWFRSAILLSAAHHSLYTGQWF